LETVQEAHLEKLTDCAISILSSDETLSDQVRGFIVVSKIFRLKLHKIKNGGDHEVTGMMKAEFITWVSDELGLERCAFCHIMFFSVHRKRGFDITAEVIVRSWADT
jgi:hypothetical protein